MKQILLCAMIALASLPVHAKIQVPTEKQMAGYVMVYHKDADHGLHMAYSWDGFKWTALNDDRPIMACDTIAMQKGIRDPYIFRNPGKDRYIIMFDNYSRNPHNFGFAETTDFHHYTPIGYFDEEGSPMARTNFSEQKHGGVVKVTKKELKRLIKYWNTKER